MALDIIKVEFMAFGLILCLFTIFVESIAIDNEALYDSYPHERSIRSSESNCVYTFNVPKTDANVCPPGSSEISKENLQELKDSILEQYQSLSEQLNNITQLLSKNEPKDNNVSGGSLIGTHYTRWGSSSCPETAELIYSGFAAKSSYSHGGGVNYLCLPQNPEFADTVIQGFQSHSYIYGVEYQKAGSPLVADEKDNNDAPCAVCHISGRGESLMIPAKKKCPTGWIKEYEGLVMAQHYTHKSSEYVCVDKDMEVLPGGSPDANGGLFYAVESNCGSLKCPPYANGKEIICVVCTK